MTPSGSPLDFSVSAGPLLLMEMTPSLITAIHVPRNNYATIRVVTRLAFLSSRMQPANACFRGRRHAPNWADNYSRSEFRTCRNEHASLIGSLPDIIKAIYQLIHSKILQR